jgi:ABC-type lipoprotein export system ATPase subunit/bifunctional DNA-binding transcriptional regulator/antitoxin component of YhaV-PrlF toxin-antitoxin module
MSEKSDPGTGQVATAPGHPMIECENLVKIYKTAEIEVVALQGLDLTVEAGELMAIIGNSGSGKSTLLNALGGLDRPSAGKLLVDGKDLLKFSDAQLVAYKRDTVGFVWQNNARNLVPYLTALENVELPMVLRGTAKRRHRALKLLDMVGMAHRRHNRLSQLSGGEQQRVAIAISLANNPRLLLADEPTGSVDSKTAAHILDVFRELTRNLGLTVVIVTHDLQLSKKVDRVVAIRDGRTSSEYIRRQSVREEMETLRGLGEEVAQETHEELVVVDRTGRLQVPAAYLEALGLKGKNKVKVELEGRRIVLYAPGTADAASAGTSSGEPAGNTTDTDPAETAGNTTDSEPARAEEATP